MPATTFSSPLRPDKTMSIAFAAVALLGFFELAAVGVHYVGKMRAGKNAPGAVATETNPAAISSPVPADTAVPTSASSAAPATAQSSPSNAALSVAEHLLKEAALLRERGDTTNALARLQDAAQRDPKNANVLAEMAMLYESIQLLDRSNETWRKIQEIGPSAGPLYELAELKLKVGVTPPNVAAAAAGPGFAGVSPLDAGTTRVDRDGIPDGSTFGITEATVSENADPDAQTNLTLRVGVKKRPNAIADHTKVKIQVYFYDTVENNKVALTDAEVNYEWITPDHDWKKNNPEILSVTYVRLKNGAISSEAALAEAAAQVTPPSGSRKATIKKQTPDSGNRQYAGYQVRVYYNDQLQDVRAEPTKLLNLFPPPLTLTNSQQ